ncbi:dynamin family protein [Virgibacillus halophilus]|uniref:Dynamin family protein n=1 Tax=Tigheibacillus halophilus TaxID=361280 RepID=A0ABU5CBE8_9BACI|nr:dynamin family protein [Virgibacillus halophilus]
MRIASGNGTARVYFQREEPVEYEEPYDIDMVKEYCKDKDDIKQIDIHLKDTIIPSGKAIIDTPGIDAADDADRLITESSLHKVDTLFYVMDYNHVQSEVNLHFLQQIQEMKLPFYIIINQIDKHEEQELPFTAFEKSISDTLSQWKLFPQEIYYTSLVRDTAAHNQFKRVQKEIEKLLQQKTATETRVTDATMAVADAHRDFLKESACEGTNSEENIGHPDAAEKLSGIEVQLEILSRKPSEIKEAVKDELNQTLKNAYLMPAVLRDKAASFLKTQQPDFKIGLFASHKKDRGCQTGSIAKFSVAFAGNH